MNVMEKPFARMTACASAGAMLMTGLSAVAADAPLDRTQLPVPEPKRPV